MKRRVRYALMIGVLSAVASACAFEPPEDELDSASFETENTAEGNDDRIALEDEGRGT